MRHHLPPIQKSDTENKTRLYWAVARIFIALTSTGLFLVFLVSTVTSFIDAQTTRDVVDVTVLTLDWFRLNDEEVETTRNLLLNITYRVLDPNEQKDTSQYTYLSNGNITVSYLATLQQLSSSSFSQLINTASSVQALTDTELVLFPQYQQQVTQLQTQLLSNIGQFSWNLYFQYTDLFVTIRLALITVLTRNVDYQQQDISRYIISLIVTLNYFENLSQTRDNIFKYVYVNFTNHILLDSTHDAIFGHYRGYKIFNREMIQKLPPNLQSIDSQTTNTSLWVYNSLRFDNEIVTIQNESLSLFKENFNHTDFYDLTIYILHRTLPIRLQIRASLVTNLGNFMWNLDVSLALACIGIVMELLAAVSLLYQALPIVLLYIRLSIVIREVSPSRVSLAERKPSIRHTHT